MKQSAAALAGSCLIAAAPSAESVLLLRGVVAGQHGALAAGGGAKFGSLDCPCIGFDDIEGETLAHINSTDVKYPADLGGSCQSWDEGRSPLCKGASPPKWCKQEWCYVDPRNCKIPVMPKMSDYQPKAMYQNMPLHFSYSTCDSKDTYTKEISELGSAGCRCVGFDNSPGTTNVTIGGKQVEYPAEIGGQCKAWDLGSNPDCKGANPSAWCAKKWCFVDPCSCSGLPAPPKTSDYLGEGTFQGKPVHYSYATCGEIDDYSSAEKKKEAEAGFDCAAHEMPDSFGSKKCPCVGFDNITGETLATVGGKKVIYPADLGGSCEAWDTGVNPSCKGDKPEPWCKEKWCYVDPRKCDIDVMPKMSPPETSYQPDARYQNLPLYYSYSTCGSKDSWAKSVANVGKPGCRCIGIDNSPGTTIANVGGGKMVEYPAEIGGECKAWDVNRHPRCKGDKAEQWCSKQWCFVDIASCTAKLDTTPTASGYMGDATFQGRPIYYSYNTCGEENLYTGSDEAYNHSGYKKDWANEYRNGDYPKWKTP